MIEAARQDGLAIGTESDGVDLFGMALEGGDYVEIAFIAGGGGPERQGGGDNKTQQASRAGATRSVTSW